MKAARELAQRLVKPVVVGLAATGVAMLVFPNGTDVALGSFVVSNATALGIGTGIGSLVAENIKTSVHAELNKYNAGEWALKAATPVVAGATAIAFLYVASDSKPAGLQGIAMIGAAAALGDLAGEYAYQYYIDNWLQSSGDGAAHHM